MWNLHSKSEQWAEKTNFIGAFVLYVKKNVTPKYLTDSSRYMLSLFYGNSNAEKKGKSCFSSNSLSIYYTRTTIYTSILSAPCV